jgi:hypothetical protein
MVAFLAGLHPNAVHTLKPKRVQIFKKSVRAGNKSQQFTIKKIRWLRMFKEINPACSENYTKPINTKYRVTDG